ncbi:MAG: glycosyltransferase family 39 protein [Candidatus Omnitrophica bacterium]|nr:glycosyltransferase family 39 protein [Candidatus Omnitrophota bacterium]
MYKLLKSRWGIAAFALVLLFALFLRLYDLDKYSLGYDEAVTVLDERGLDTLPHFSKLFDGDFLVNNHDYLTLYSHGFVYYWQKLLGKADYPLRLSSVIFSLLAICLLYILTREFFGLRTAYLAIFLFAVSPFSIYYAQELRPYSASSFFTLLAVYYFLKMLDKGTWKHNSVFAISNVLNVYFNPSAIMVLFSFAVFFAFNIRKYKAALKRFLATNAAIVFLLSPVFLSIYYNLGFIFKDSAHFAVDADFGNYPSWCIRMSIKDLLFTFKNFSMGYNVDYFSFLGKSGTLVYALLFILGVFSLRKKTETRLLLCCLFIPILSLFLISGIKPCYVDRYFFAIFSFYLIFVAAGLNKLFNKPVFIFTAAAIIGINLFALKNYYLDYLPSDHRQHVGVPGRQNIKGAAEEIANNYKPGDRIMHTCRNTVFPLKFYIRQFTRNDLLIKEVDRGSVIFVPYFYKDKRVFIYDYARPYPNLVSMLEFKAVSDLGAADRLWLIFSDWYFREGDSNKSEIVKIIGKNFREDNYNKFNGLNLYAFEKY